MFKRPEELIMAVLAALWVVLTYFLAGYIGAPTQTALLIAALTLIWAGVFFMLWQRGHSAWSWPVFLGLLVACWWPALDWYAIRNLVAAGVASETIVIGKPWYASWTFKIILAVVPVVLGYGFKWKIARKKINSIP
ncbi:MAG: hypothetical protein Q4A84_05545 [Neisseria sp.]|uniref:hypothetical protein n=1 Tax=Neisseria sp. TaxID=192066 RepID=UPI0026DABFB4|nr:hypothetical protein [Neisseria sp.]MDO4641152.1 hypothetical protein [Neisseria sp.]